MTRIRTFAIALAAGLASSAGHAQQIQPKITLSIDVPAEAAVHSVTYGCGDGISLPVSYINADPNFLAIVPVEGKSIVCASVISGSGARYAAGTYETRTPSRSWNASFRRTDLLPRQRGAAPWPDAISDRRSSSTPLLKREKAPAGTYGSSQTFRRILHS